MAGPRYPKTRSPFLKSVTALPTAATSPANSLPDEPKEQGHVELCRGDGLEVTYDKVAEIQRCRADPDQDFLVFRDGLGHLCNPKNLRRPVLREDNCFQACSYISGRNLPAFWGALTATIWDYRRALGPRGVYLMAGGDWPQIRQAMLWGPLLSRFGRSTCPTSTGRPVPGDPGYPSSRRMGQPW
jgi:hypothetical protein